MKIFSELTNKYYSTVEECLNAEKKYNEEKDKEHHIAVAGIRRY